MASLRIFAASRGAPALHAFLLGTPPPTDMPPFLAGYRYDGRIAALRKPAGQKKATRRACSSVLRLPCHRHWPAGQFALHRPLEL